MAKKTPLIRYSPHLARKICDLIAEGESLQSISQMDGMPPRRTMRNWLSTYPALERDYEIARRERTDNLVDEAIEIADSVSGCTDNAKVQAARLAIDTRRWLASKLLPERFSEHARVELTGKSGRDLVSPAETDPTKIALVLMQLLNSARGGKDDPSRAVSVPYNPPWKQSALTAPTILPADPVESEPEPEITPAMRREHIRWFNLTHGRNQ
jgi:hypothetical protein